MNASRYGEKRSANRERLIAGGCEYGCTIAVRCSVHSGTVIGVRWQAIVCFLWTFRTFGQELILCH